MRVGNDYLPHQWQWNIVTTLGQIFSIDSAFDSSKVVAELLPGGVRERRTWRCGSINGEAGSSLSVEFVGPKRGIWHDFATGQAGDALDLVKAVVDCTTLEAIAWAERWLGIAPGEARTPRRPASAISAEVDKPPTWPKIWSNARPIGGTLAETYLANRGLVFTDLHGDVLRFAAQRARLRPGTTDQLEHHPAMLALLRDVLTGEACGLQSIFLRQDGADRLRDEKGKLSAGRIAGAAVMVSGFEDVTYGLVITEGVETGLAVLQAGLAPGWACCGTAGIAAFAVLPVIETLTIAADRGGPGEQAAAKAVARWTAAGRAASVALPLTDDWAAEQGERRHG